MKWLGRRESGNVEDRRGMAGPVAVGGGLIGLVILLINAFMGGDTGELLNQLQQQAAPTEQRATSPEEAQLAKFASVVLADNEDVWTKIFRENGATYDAPKMVLFSNATQSGCGNASSSVGPFYCPADNKVYLDLAFFEELKNRLGAGGDFAMAYVIAHEVGHHVQNLMGTSDKVRQLQSRTDEKGANRLSVALELQADFYAGLWTHYNQQMNNVLEPGDIEEALGAASAVGDDRLQKRAQGYIVPDAFTHGTSEQRMYWFKRGYESGDLKAGNTFEEVLN